MDMLVSASDIVVLYRPQECELRTYLRTVGVKERPSDPFEEVLINLGNRHEREHLGQLPQPSDLSKGTPEFRIASTIEALKGGAPSIYHGLLSSDISIDGAHLSVMGEPDFIVRSGSAHIIRDAKLALRVEEDNHPELLRQLELYGWLYERVCGHRPHKLELLTGRKELVGLEYDGGVKVLELLKRLAELKRAGAPEPYAPVGWSKCNPCTFREHCWPRAKARHDVSLVRGVDKGLSRALRAVGVESYDELLSHFPDERALSDFKKPRGTQEVRVGKAAKSILQCATALATGQEILIASPDVPKHPAYVMFDIEGMPPHLDELDKTYLWGLKVFGDRNSEHIAVVAEFDADGDRRCWFAFLDRAGELLKKYGDIRFVHWANYEKAHLTTYLNRYGDRDGIGARVTSQLLDLLRVVEASVVLPLPSLSLKVVEKYTGYERMLPEANGQWSMAKFIEACETSDAALRKSNMDQIVAYNNEDLDASWHVFKWLVGRAT